MAKKTRKAAEQTPPVEARSPVELRAEAICFEHGNRPDELLEILHRLQHDVGYVPDATLPIIANALNLSRAEVYGVVTFYHDFKREKPGQHTIKVCRAEACQAMGTRELCRHAEQRLGTPMNSTSADGKYTLEAAYCLGNCALSPAMLIGDRLYGRLDAQRFDEVIASLDKTVAAR